MAGDEAGIDAAGGELRMRGDPAEQIEVAGHADDVGIGQSAMQQAPRLVAVLPWQISLAIIAS